MDLRGLVFGMPGFRVWWFWFLVLAFVGCCGILVLFLLCFLVFEASGLLAELMVIVLGMVGRVSVWCLV